MEDRETGNNKGFGFVTYFTKEDAEKAIVTLSDLELKVGLSGKFSNRFECSYP